MNKPMQNSISSLFLIILLLFVTSSDCLKLGSKTKYSAFLKKMQLSGELSKNKADSYLRKNSKNSLKLIKEGIDALNNDTSCKVAAKYILFTIGNIEKEEDRHYLKLTNKTDIDLSNIEELLKDGYILQIEVKPNHHFVVFLENGRNLYVLQAFQNIFSLKNWLDDDYSSLPMTLTRFIRLMKSAMNKDNDRETFLATIMQLFLPKSLWTDIAKATTFAQWFSYRNYIEIVKVDYVPYNFDNRPDKNKNFKEEFDKIDHSFRI